MACIAFDPMDMAHVLEAMSGDGYQVAWSWVVALESWRVNGLVFNVS